MKKIVRGRGPGKRAGPADVAHTGSTVLMPSKETGERKNTLTQLKEIFSLGIILAHFLQLAFSVNVISDKVAFKIKTKSEPVFHYFCLHPFYMAV